MIAAFLVIASIVIGLWFGLRKPQRKLIEYIQQISIIVYVDVMKSSESEECGSSHESYEIKGSSKLGKYSRAVVAVDNEECSRIGKIILLKGGKAADAAIAASLCNGVLNSHSMGIGGGCVLVIYSKFAISSIIFFFF